MTLIKIGYPRFELFFYIKILVSEQDQKFMISYWMIDT